MMTPEDLEGLPRIPTLAELKCCLLDATRLALIECDLVVPELMYPSACGSPPKCLDKSYMTAFLGPGGIYSATEAGCGFIREALFVVCYGVCTGVNLDDVPCAGDHIGACDDFPPGSYAAESVKIDNIMNAMVDLSKCFDCTLGDCDKPMLVGTEQSCGSFRPTVSVTWRLRW